MLVQFVVKNFGCFKEETKLSMIASNYDRTTRWEDNVIEVPKFGLNLLRSAVIYGANASGKSKLLQAFGFMSYMVRLSSIEKQVDDSIGTTTFKLNTETENAPSLFEIIFILNNEMFRYGFELTKKEVVSEWLYHRENTKEVELFHRDFQTIEVHSKFKKGKILVDNNMVKKNTLLISSAAQFNDSFASSVLFWFYGFGILSGLDDSLYTGYSVDMLSNNSLKPEIMQFINSADLNIVDMKPIELNVHDLPKDMPKNVQDSIIKNVKTDNGNFIFDVSVIHKKYGKNNDLEGYVEFLFNEESSGTKKYFAFSGLLIMTLKKGTITAIDELDAKLHPNLVCKIVALFNSKETNPLNAQLIFNTHDTNLLSSGLFRRDQIWFTEKDRYGAATLYSLADFKKDGGTKARNAEDYESNYIQGKYGAVPYLGDFDKLFKAKKEVAYENEG